MAWLGWYYHWPTYEVTHVTGREGFDAWVESGGGGGGDVIETGDVLIEIGAGEGLEGVFKTGMLA